MALAEDDLWKLEFNCAKSRRYYSRRRAFFTNSHKLISFVNLISGLSAVTAVVVVGSPSFAAWAAAIISIGSAIDLVFDLAALGRQNDAFYRRYSILLRDIEAIDEPSPDILSELKRKRLEIEEDEPSNMAIVEVQSYNDELVARGADQNYLRKVRWYQWPLKHIVTLPPDHFDQAGST